MCTRGAQHARASSLTPREKRCVAHDIVFQSRERRLQSQAWPQPAKDTYLALNQSSEGEVVEEVGEVSPDVGVAIFAQAFVVEAVHLGDLPRFVVSAEDCYTVAIAKLEGNKEGDRLDGIVPPIDIITHE